MPTFNPLKIKEAGPIWPAVNDVGEISSKWLERAVSWRVFPLETGLRGFRRSPWAWLKAQTVVQ